MAEGTIERRQVLRRAGVAAVGGVVLAGVGTATPAMAGSKDENGLTGSWLVRRRDTGSSQTVLFTAGFAAGAVFSTQDINPAGSAAFGTWAREEDGRFQLTFWAGEPGTSQQTNGTVRVRARGQLQNNTISGTYTVEIFDPTGKPVPSQGGTGKFFSGHRIEA